MRESETYDRKAFVDMLSVVSVICVDITYDSTYNYIESVNQGEHDNRNENL